MMGDFCLAGPGGFGGQGGRQAWSGRAGQRGFQGMGQRPGPGFGDGSFGPGARGMAPFWESESVVEELGLTDDQVSRLAESREVTLDALEDMDGAVYDAREALHEEMSKDAPDLATASDLLDDVSDAMNERKQVVLNHAVLVRNVLSAEQEDALPGAMRQGRRAARGAMMDVHREVREAIFDGATLEEVYAIIDSHDLPDQIAERAKTMAERRFDRQQGVGEKAGTPTRKSDMRPRAGENMMQNRDATGTRGPRSPRR